jgi:hypothetical protein
MKRLEARFGRHAEDEFTLERGILAAQGPHAVFDAVAGSLATRPARRWRAFVHRVGEAA